MIQIILTDPLGNRTIVVVDRFDSIVVDIPLTNRQLLRYTFTSIDNNNFIQEQFLVTLPLQITTTASSSREP